MSRQILAFCGVLEGITLNDVFKYSQREMMAWFKNTDNKTVACMELAECRFKYE
jgi:hypothetical protein